MWGAGGRKSPMGGGPGVGAGARPRASRAALTVPLLPVVPFVLLMSLAMGAMAQAQTQPQAQPQAQPQTQGQPQPSRPAASRAVGAAPGQAPTQSAGKAPGPASLQAQAQAQAPWPVAPGAAPAAASAEQQLRAIRDALLDKAMAGSTRVSSTSWIDERGELREAAEFRSDMEVRGVRVLEYLGQPDAVQAVVSTRTAESGGAGAPAANAAAEAACRDTAGLLDWRHPLSLTVHLDAAQSPDLMGPARQALGIVAQALQRQAALTRGSLAAAVPGAEGSVGVATAATGTVPSTSIDRYERAVVGVAQPRQALGLSIRARLMGEAELQAAQPTWRRTLAGWRDWVGASEPWERPAVAWVQISLGRSAESPILLMERAVPVAVSARARPARHLEPQAATALEAQAAAWWLAVQDALSCEPLSFEARSQGDGRFVLMAGRDAGLRPGDRLVLSDSRHVPRRLLDADAAPHLALVEVGSVQANRAEARRIAGPAVAPDASAQWVAMPYTQHTMAARAPSGKGLK